jgi:hypothetical protein
MTKAELEATSVSYHELVEGARRLQSTGLVKNAMEMAAKAWECVEGMLQYERRYEKAEVGAVDAFDIVLNAAPLLLDLKALNQLEQFIASRRKLSRDKSLNLPERIVEARGRIEENHRLFGLIQERPDMTQDALRRELGGEQAHWRATVDAWELMGLLHRTPLSGSFTLRLATRMGEVVKAKCPRCAESINAPKAMVLEKLKCPGCAHSVWFVMLTGGPTADRN